MRRHYETKKYDGFDIGFDKRPRRARDGSLQVQEMREAHNLRHPYRAGVVQTLPALGESE